jgi:hypothetical protein
MKIERCVLCGGLIHHASHSVITAPKDPLRFTSHFTRARPTSRYTWLDVQPFFLEKMHSLNMSLYITSHFFKVRPCGM